MQTSAILKSISAPTPESKEVHNYVFMIKCNPNLELADSIQSLLEEKSPIKFSLNAEELKKGLHLTLLFVGDMHAVCTKQLPQLKEDVETILNSHRLETPLVVESFAKFGRYKQVLVLKLEQQFDVFKKVNQDLKKMLLEKYKITANTDFPFSTHASVAYTDNNIEIPDVLVKELNAALYTLKNKQLLPNVEKIELSHKPGTGPNVPASIAATFAISKNAKPLDKVDVSQGQKDPVEHYEPKVDFISCKMR